LRPSARLVTINSCGGIDMRPSRVLCVSALLLCLVSWGCARRVPAADLGAAGAEVGIRATMKSGETVAGRLLSMTGDLLVVEAIYEEAGGAEVVGRGSAARVVVDGGPVAGAVLGVEGARGARVARVERKLPVADVRSATFHRSGREASLGPLVGLMLGPLLGSLLGLLL
jgi:hypothetical protein